MDEQGISIVAVSSRLKSMSLAALRYVWKISIPLLFSVQNSELFYKYSKEQMSDDNGAMYSENSMGPREEETLRHTSS